MLSVNEASLFSNDKLEANSKRSIDEPGMKKIPHHYDEGFFVLIQLSYNKSLGIIDVSRLTILAPLSNALRTSFSLNLSN